MKQFHTMRTSTYDVHNLCNLKCEGCSYFVSDRAIKAKEPSLDEYDAFFRSEVDRGVTYPIFTGAEPSLKQAPLHVAARLWRHGAVFTNGIKPIDADLPFRVVISVWSGRKNAKKLRGANSYDKALRTASADRRAIVFYTVTRQSIDDIRSVVDDCASLGLHISFSFFSMTSEFRRRLEANLTSEYIRFSSTENNPSLSVTDRRRAAATIIKCMDEYPDTVLFSRYLADFMSDPRGIHVIDPLTNLATNCSVLNSQVHRSFNYDLSRDDRKDCCAPDLDCRDCRVLGGALGTLLAKNARNRRISPSANSSFSELRELMMRLYYWDWDPHYARA